MTEREGFEPSVPVRVRVLSRDVPSTTQPSFPKEFNSVRTLKIFRKFLLRTLSHSLSVKEKEEPLLMKFGSK